MNALLRNEIEDIQIALKSETRITMNRDAVDALCSMALRTAELEERLAAMTDTGQMLSSVALANRRETIAVEAEVARLKEALAAAQRDERERCAQICDGMVHADKAAAAIRDYLYIKSKDNPIR